jgi:hypothetical protein
MPVAARRPKSPLIAADGSVRPLRHRLTRLANRHVFNPLIAVLCLYFLYALIKAESF